MVVSGGSPSPHGFQSQVDSRCLMSSCRIRLGRWNLMISGSLSDMISVFQYFNLMY